MNYRITNGSISYGADTILEEINFEINGKEKVAIVGRNGSGKSTLLQAIVNPEKLEEGIGENKFNIYKEGNPIIGYLKQIDFEDEKLTLLDEILKVYKPIIELEEKIKRLEEELNKNSTEELAKEYTKARDRYEFLDGYVYKKEYQTAIRKFGFSKEDENKKINEFSGGQKTKIAFIKLLLSKPDILLLDEPTNHLDIETIEWLEGYLKNYPKAVVIVSHDRMFLNKIVTRVYEIEYGVLSVYTGNYTDFEEQKRIRYEKQLKDFEYQQKEIKRLTAIADRFRYKPTKAKMAMSKLKQIERMVKIEEPNKYDLRSFKTNFDIKRESGKQVLTVKELEIGYNESIAKITFNLYKGQKLGIIGANGKGKSTLLKTLTNEISKISGLFEYGHNVDFEYFDQQMAFENKDKTVFDDFAECFPKLTTTEIRNSLAAFMFYGEDVFKEIKVLSGGEKVRLKLCEILKKGPNLLILDEPTNHMDIIGKESLELLLKEYKGTLIFVSHDRYFVNKIADSILIFENNKVTYFDGTYDEYIQTRTDEERQNIQKEKKVKNLNNEYFISKEKNRIKNKIQKLEVQISECEEKIKNLEKELLKSENSSDYIKLTEIQNNIKIINNEIENKMNEWAELENDLNLLEEE